MKKDIADIIHRNFLPALRNDAMEELSSITLKHVMAESVYNLENTRHAILKLSKGSLHELKRPLNCPKRDFRDVIYWASLA